MDDNPYRDDREEVRSADLAAAEERAARQIGEWDRRSGIPAQKPRHRVKAGRREVAP